LSALLARFPPGIAVLAKRCLLRLRRVLPGSCQLVYDYPTSLVVSFGMSERGYEGIVALAVLPRSVRLYVDKSVPDPKGLLEGAGGKVRSVTIASASDLDRGDVHALVEAAIEHSGVKLPRTRSIRIIFKSRSKKPRRSPAARRSGPAARRTVRRR
jgi:hypothetical protein